MLDAGAFRGDHKELMQQVNISPGRALCQYCGAQVQMNRLSTHIAKEHPRPAAQDMTPSLVPKRPVLKKRFAK